MKLIKKYVCFHIFEALLRNNKGKIRSISTGKMNLWRSNYELFLMGNNKTLMKSITFSQSAGKSFAFKNLIFALRGSCLRETLVAKWMIIG